MPTADAASPARTATDGGTDTDTEAAGENVLVLASGGTGEADAYCADRLSSPQGTISPNALLISLEESPDARFDAVVRRGTARPSNVAIVCCDDTRSAAAADPGGGHGHGHGTGSGHGPGLSPGPWVATVESPADLTGLGVRIRQVLSNWADDPEPVELCFHDLGTLLEYVDVRAAFRFCHAVTRHIRSTDANSHFHLDPDAASERTLNTLRPLFDRVEDRR
ncbi:MAG: hypothetical protein V5A61_10290 [Haloarculaceae archaeon]|jgi:hypothetical protein